MSPDTWLALIAGTPLPSLAISALCTAVPLAYLLHKRGRDAAAVDRFIATHRQHLRALDRRTRGR